MRSLFCDVVKFDFDADDNITIIIITIMGMMQAKRVKVVTRLKDFSGRRRPVSRLLNPIFERFLLMDHSQLFQPS